MFMFSSIDGIIEELKKNNSDFRITTQRKIIIKAILAMKGHFSAEEVTNGILQLYPDLTGISKATIYGTLDILVKNGILTNIQGKTFKDEVNGGYYARNYYDRRLDPHINMVCISCGKIEDLNEIPLNQIIKQINTTSSWELSQEPISLYGICKNCRVK